MAKLTRAVAEHPFLVGLLLATVAAVWAYKAEFLLLMVLGPFFAFGLGAALSSYLHERVLPYTPQVGGVPDGVAESNRYRDRLPDGGTALGGDFGGDAGGLGG